MPWSPHGYSYQQSYFLLRALPGDWVAAVADGVNTTAQGRGIKHRVVKVKVVQANTEQSVDAKKRSVWRIDRSTSSVKFSVKKLLFITVNGLLSDLDGLIVFDENVLSQSSVNASMSAATVDTSNKQRDAHLRSPAFLDTTNYPRIQFQSTKIGRGTDRDMLVVKGVLTIKGSSQQVQLIVTEVDRSKSPDGQEVIYYVAETELDRYAFGIKQWPGVIGRKLKVVIDVQANRE
ncbi:MAG: hypothetical protein C5B55_01010 [Blastocatellia bacterium]|nr:MAG: hypothetical protein C5B55_01010 [Blastocatellia bacterium]